MSVKTSRREALQLLSAAVVAPWVAPRAAPAATPAAEASRVAAGAGTGGAGADATRDADRRLRTLIEASEAAFERLEPMPRNALARAPGDPPFVDPLSEAYFDGRRSRAEQDRAGLRAIDPAALSPVYRIAYDVFDYRTDRELERFRSGRWRVQRVAPLNASSGLHVQLPDYVSGAGAPFVAEADYEIGLRRLEGFAGYLDSLGRELGEGLRTGHVHSQVIVRQVIAQCEAFLAQPVEQSPFYAAATRMPAAFTPAQRERFEREYRRATERTVLPAYARLRDYLRNTYLPRAPEGPGLWSMRDGLDLYAAALEHHVTLPVTAAELHDTGLHEVARYRREMEAVRREVGFAGDLPAFFEHVRTDPRFYFTEPEDLIAKFEAIEARIRAGIPKLFARSPRAPFVVRGLPAIGGQRGTGYYRPGPPDGVSPGVLWFNMAMLNTRPIPTLETLTLHEGIPGHHFQITLVLEDPSLPAILRFGGLTSYSEGWALYAESLGRELGMFTDPYQYFGHLDMGMLRAVRLVVDTGLHAQQWSRQRAIDYMLANTSMARRDVEVEIDRYISWPGQACAYKPGELKIRQLRECAAARFGARFDVKAFHGQVLDTGALPLAVLERKVERWIATAG